jgi:hypothetical protein
VHFLQTAKACYCPKEPPARPNNFQPDDLLLRTIRVLPSEERPPETWSDYEAYLRTGVWASTAAPRNNGLGGARRRLPLFAVDYGRTKKGDAEGFDCTKHQNAQGAMTPVMMVRLRSSCRLAKRQTTCSAQFVLHLALLPSRSLACLGRRGIVPQLSPAPAPPA